MKKNLFLANILLIGVLFVVLLTGILVRTFAPAAMLPPLNIPNMVVVSLVALLAEALLVQDAKRCWIIIAVMSAVSFALLPLMAGFACVHTAWKLGLVGGAVFTLTAAVFTSVSQRLASGPRAKAALFVTTLGIYLAAQCFMGIIL